MDDATDLQSEHARPMVYHSRFRPRRDSGSSTDIASLYLKLDIGVFATEGQ